MNNIKIYVLILISILVLFSCEKDQDAMLTQLEVMKEQFTPSYTSIAIECQLNTSASIKDVYVQYATSQDFAEYQEEKMQDSGRWQASLTNLQPNTTYYVRYFVKNKYSSAISNEVSEFKTLSLSLPSITTSAVTQIMDTSAIAGGNVTSDGGMSVTERGVVYSTSQNPTTSNSKVTSGSGTGSFTCNITKLQEGTTYYVRAYAINEKGTAYGEQKSFTPSSVALPTVKTSSATNISKTSATVGGNVTSDGGASVTERGVVYSTSQNPTTSNSKVTSGSGTGSFTCNLTGLQPNTTYCVRAYATNEKGTSYGNQVVFTTLEAPIENGHEYVDLSLSVKWATCNVGASSPEDYGDYFAWGETEPKSSYDWSTYKYCNGTSTTLTKYCPNSSYGTIDQKYTLELSDDAARANWGGRWRMPTMAEQDELRNNCTWTWTTQNGVKGYKVTSKSNGNSIFLPAAGWRYGSSLSDAGSDGFYLSSSLRPGSPYNAYELYFYSALVDRRSYDRSYGHSVRPVCP